VGGWVAGLVSLAGDVGVLAAASAEEAENAIGLRTNRQASAARRAPTNGR
jgi:hypothetical protein